VFEPGAHRGAAEQDFLDKFSRDTATPAFHLSKTLGHC
jgi:hypothetical protein